MSPVLPSSPLKSLCRHETYSVLKLIFSNIQDCELTKLLLPWFGWLVYSLGVGLGRDKDKWNTLAIFQAKMREGRQSENAYISISTSFGEPQVFTIEPGMKFWPTFNVADIAITIGVILLIGGMVFRGSQQKA
jgi:hypothetical protein